MSASGTQAARKYPAERKTTVLRRIRGAWPENGEDISGAMGGGVQPAGKNAGRI